MVFLDTAAAPAPPSPWPRRILTAALLLGVVASVLYWQFRFYPEKKKVAEFMDALVAADYRRAYELWEPSPSYRYQDFLEDWGEMSSWGRIQSYEILRVESGRETVLHVPVAGGGRRTLGLKGDSSGAVVLVKINERQEAARIWVEKKDLSLSFPPF